MVVKRNNNRRAYGYLEIPEEESVNETEARNKKKEGR